MKCFGQWGVLGVVCLILLSTSQPVFAKVLYVSPDGNDLNDGLSWSTAKRTVTTALQTTLPGDEVWVRYGVYVERITLKSGVSVYGGFRGNETSLSQRPAFPRPSPDPYETVLDGNQAGSVVTSPTPADQDFRLDGFTIRNGRATRGGGLYLGTYASCLTVANCTICDNSATISGGGVFCTSSSYPKLMNCVISNNIADHGGGMFCDHSYPTLVSCVFSGNIARDTGGGLYCYGSSPTLSDCTLSQNSARVAGGVYCSRYSSPILTNCTLSGNSAADTGGGMYCEFYSIPVVTDCTFSGNDGGGIICLSTSSPTLAGCTISYNTGGGVICLSGSSPTLTECVISGNSGTGYGGGLFCHDSSPTLKRCIISDNTADEFGGGVCAVGSSLTLTGCTITDNHAPYGGGGVYCEHDAIATLTNCILSSNSAEYGAGIGCYYASLRLTNCTVVYNIANDVGGIAVVGGDTSVRNTIIASNDGGGIQTAGTSTFRYNCVWGNFPYDFAGDIGDPTGTDGNISIDPLLVAGHLLPGSPSIDAGDNSVVTTDMDIDGEPRIANGTVEIGADEFHPPIVHGLLVFNDFAGSLPPMVDWEIRRDSTQVCSLLLEPYVDPEGRRYGKFVIPRAPAGQFALSVKPLTYLRRTVELDTSEGSVLDLEISLTNGDIDGDNEVTLFDFGRLVSAFGSMPGDSNWDTSADLDGDNEVTLFDFGILVRNFGEIGDE